MKVAISAISEKLDQEVTPVFGRCPGYIIAEIKEGKIENTRFLQNPGISTGMGAGIAAAQEVANQKVDAVITGNIGPNAFRVLNQTGIKVYNVSGITIENALQKLAQGNLEEVKGSTAPGHFGMNENGRGPGRGFGRGRGPPR